MSRLAESAEQFAGRRTELPVRFFCWVVAAALPAILLLLLPVVFWFWSILDVARRSMLLAVFVASMIPLALARQTKLVLQDGNSPAGAVLEKHILLRVKAYRLAEYASWSRWGLGTQLVKLHKAVPENAPTATGTASTALIPVAAFRNPQELIDFLTRHLPEKEAAPNAKQGIQEAIKDFGPETYERQMQRVQQETRSLLLGGRSLALWLYLVPMPPQLAMSACLLFVPLVVLYALLRRRWISLLEGIPALHVWAFQIVGLPVLALASRCLRDFYFVGDLGSGLNTVTFGSLLLLAAIGFLVMHMGEQAEQRWRPAIVACALAVAYSYFLVVGLNWMGPSKPENQAAVEEVKRQMLLQAEGEMPGFFDPKFRLDTYTLHTGWLGMSWLSRDRPFVVGLLPGGTRFSLDKPIQRRLTQQLQIEASAP